jgi:cytochrome c-type biogenesis protein
MSTKALIGILLLGVMAGACDSSRTEASSHKRCAKDKEDCLPDLKYVDTNGTAYTAQQLEGKVVVVNFWATWCHPCQKEIPDLSKLYEKFKTQGVVMLGVLTDSPSDSDLLNFESDNAMTYPVVRSSSDIQMSFHYPQALPTTFVFDRGGHQVGSPHIGAISATDLEQTLGKLVAQK